MKYLCATLLIPLLFACKDRPPYDANLTAYSEPVDGILPRFQGKQMDPFWPSSSILPADLRRMSSVPLRSDGGRKDTGLAIASGKYSLITFFYTTCSGICPRITENMKSLSSQIKDQSDIQFLSITIDPTVDDEKALKNYRTKHKVEQENWIFLTGTKKDIEDLAREQFAAEIEANAGKNGLIAFVHTESIFLLDKAGYLRGMYRARGNGEFPRILNELEQLRAETPL